MLCLVSNWKGNGVSSKRSTSTSHSFGIKHPCSNSCTSIPYLYWKGLKISSFLVLNAKGGDSIRPKQKDSTSTLFSKKHFKLFLQGEFLNGQRKSIWIRGESLNLRNALKISFLYLKPYANNYEKILSKVCKNHCMWCKCGPKL
jgi:hypothetical protein